MIERFTTYTDIEEARAAAERLAKSRGWAVSHENVTIVRDTFRACNTEGIEVALSFFGS
jgi:hypothetical protein